MYILIIMFFILCAGATDGGPVTAVPQRVARPAGECAGEVWQHAPTPPWVGLLWCFPSPPLTNNINRPTKHSLPLTKLTNLSF